MLQGLRALALAAALALPALPAFAGIAFRSLDASFASALYVTSPPGDASRLFVVEQNGGIYLLIDGVKQETPFIDLFGKTNYDHQELGLLSMVFHPDYATNGFFFLNYTRTVGGQIQSVVSRFTATGDPATATSASLASEQIKLVVDQPYDNHNGGMMAFGPDGYLYIAFGDGGSAFDPENRSQNLESYMGKLLRVEADGEGLFTPAPGNPFIGATPGLDEIWAYGLRNPWRFSFDRGTGDLWIADVGQQATEEVNFVPVNAAGGKNFGWHAFEGNDCLIPAECAPIEANVTFPIYTYAHNGEARAITGGYVYRGSGIPSLQGAYVFGDYTQGTLGFLRYSPGSTPEVEVRDLTPIFNPRNDICCLTSLGEDADGELYVVTQSKVYEVYDDGEAYMDLQKVGDFEEPLYATSPPGDASRLLVSQKNGLIYLVKDGVRQETPFLDLRTEVSTEGELGLLGFVMHPNFSTNGYLYVNYTRYTTPQEEAIETIIARYTANGDPATATTADPASKLVIMQIPQPYKDDHKGGAMAFSPLDGYLYIPLGDGGCCNNVFGNAQNLGSPLGKILRIDVDNTQTGLNYAIPGDNPAIGIPGARGEIWALGLRNPFRSSFDRLTGDFYFGDVGQELIEEISFQPAASTGGENYGWPTFEGNRCNTDVATELDCTTLGPGMVPPIVDYPRELGSSVIGGAVYRGAAMPGLQGRYFYADYFQPRVFSFVQSGGVATSPREFTEDLDAKRELLEGIVALSEDGVGEMYVCCITGPVYKLVPGLGDDSEDRDGGNEGEGETPVEPLGVEVHLDAVKDATLYEDAAGAFANGAGPNIFAGRTGDNGDESIRRGLLKFNLQGVLPPDAEIVSASLRLRCSKLPVGGEDANVAVHRVLTEWSEGPAKPLGAGGAGAAADVGDSTWLHTNFNTAFWASPGGDFDPTASASIPVNSVAVHTWTSDALADDVTAWLANPASNHGWMLRGDEAVVKTARRFDSRENTTANNRPQLIIRYCGSPQEGWVFNPANGHYYRLTETLAFAEAQAQAECVGGYLATINNSAENAFLLANLGLSGPAWIGYNDRIQEGVFAWVNGESATYQNFAAGEPNGGEAADGVQLSQADGKWSDEDVAALAIAIVERDSSPFITEGEGGGEGEGAPEGDGEGAAARHSADTNGNGAIELTELLRVVQFYNSGGLQCAATPSATEDGYLPGAGPNHSCANHDSDYSPADWVITLSELLRLIQLYNFGGYQSCGGQEDGYCPA